MEPTRGQGVEVRSLFFQVALRFSTFFRSLVSVAVVTCGLTVGDVVALTLPVNVVSLGGSVCASWSADLADAFVACHDLFAPCLVLAAVVRFTLVGPAVGRVFVAVGAACDSCLAVEEATVLGRSRHRFRPVSVRVYGPGLDH